MNRFNYRVGLFSLLAGALVTLGAQAETVMIQNATVHTMGKQGVLENTDIFITGNTIERMGPDLPVPADIKVFDAEGRPVTPGLFAGVTGIGIGEVSGVEQSMDGTNELEAMHPEFDVSLAYNPHSTLVPIARVEGHTFTVLGAGMGGSMIAGQGRTVALDGGYDSFFGRWVLYVNLGRRAASKTGGSRAAQWLLLNQAVAETEKAPTRSEDALLTRAGRQTLGRYADGGTVVFSVNRAADILQTLAFARDKDINAIIHGGAEAWMVADQLARANVPVILNPLQNLPSNFDMLGSRLDNAALLQAAGVTIAFSGAESHNARKLRQMAGNAASYGLAPEAALAALTSNPARIFGVQGSFGSLEEGKRADLVLWSGDPLEVTTVADLVITNGTVDSMESRQTRLRDRYLPEQTVMPRAYLKP